MSIREYCDTRYTQASRPNERQIIRLIQRGELPGVKRGKYYYIDISFEEEITGNKLVDHVLQEAEQNLFRAL